MTGGPVRQHPILEDLGLAVDTLREVGARMDSNRPIDSAMHTLARLQAHIGVVLDDPGDDRSATESALGRAVLRAMQGSVLARSASRVHVTPHRIQDETPPAPDGTE